MSPPQEKDKAFDNDVNTKWLTFNEFGKINEEVRDFVIEKGILGDEKARMSYIYLDYNSTNNSKPWLQYQFEEKTVITQYQITSANDERYRDPYSWRLLGSNNGKDFSELDARGSEFFSERLQTKTFNVNNPNAYLYYKLEVIDNLASYEAKRISQEDKTRKRNAAEKYIKIGKQFFPDKNEQRNLSNFANTKTTLDSGIKNNLGILQIAEFKLGDRIVTTPSVYDFTQPGNTSVIQASTSDSPIGEDGSKAFDNNSNTKWLIRANTGWIQYDFKQPTAINRYTITSANDESSRDPKKWILQASNDGNNFVTLDTRNSQFFQNRGSKQEYEFVNTTAYRYYRLNIQENHGANAIQIAEIEFGGQKDKAFDNNLDTNWLVNSKSGEIGYEFEKPVVVNQYTIISAKSERAKDPKDWVLEASNDGNNYTLLNRVDGAKFEKDNESKLVQFSNTNAYRFYRLRVIDNNGDPNQFQIAELDLGRQDREIIAPIQVSNFNSPTSEKGEKAFDGRNDTKWLIRDFNNKDGDWIQYDFGKLNSDYKVVNRYSITSGNDEQGRDPKVWLLKGSNDNENFTVLDSRSNEFFNQRQLKRTFEFENTTAYRYYRLEILQNNGARELQIADIELGNKVQFYNLLNNEEEISKKLFDNQVETSWQTDAKTGSILYDFDRSILINQYRITSSDRNPQADPQSWVFEGSNDGKTFTQLDQKFGVRFTARYQTQAFNFDNLNSYRYYRLRITENNGADYLKIAELEFAQVELVGSLNVEAINSGNIQANAEQKTTGAAAINLATSSVRVQSDTTANLDGSSKIVVKNLNVSSLDNGFNAYANAKTTSQTAVSDVTARGYIEQANINAKTDVGSGTNISARKVNLESLQYGVGSEARSEVDNLAGPDEAYTKNYLNVRSEVNTSLGVNITADTFAVNAVTADGKYIQEPKDYDLLSANDEFREGSQNRLSTRNIRSGGRKLDSITVNTLQDENDGFDKNGVSLREAIAVVSNGGLITFADNLFNNNTATLSLNKGTLQILNSLRIDAGNNRQLIIKGNNNHSILNIDDLSLANSAPVTLTGITIQEGNGEFGGGILNKENLTLINSVVSNNQAKYGGGIYNSGILTLNNSTVDNNRSKEYGGGIYQQDGLLNIVNSTLSNNQGNAGGGIYQNAGTLNINNSALYSNAGNIGSNGGAIYQNAGTLNINNSSLYSNGATNGNAIYQNAGTLNINNSSLYSNSGNVPSNGGAIYQNAGTLNINSSAFYSNGATNGGAIYQNAGTLNINNSSLYSNRAAKGGGIYQNSGQRQVSENNKVINQYTSTLTLLNSTISNNNANLNGGGIYQNAGKLTLLNSTIFSNQSKNGGGGIYQNINQNINEDNSETLDLNNSIIAKNKGADFYSVKSPIFKTTGTNLIEDGSLKGANIINQDPLLAPLAYNGGLTPTHDLLTGSPAIDASDTGSITDQRGYSRPSGSRYDLGAVEFRKLQAQHFDVSSVLNIDAIVNRNQNQTDTTQSSIDNNNKALITESFAKFAGDRSGNGLIDNGFFSAYSFHPDIQLSYRNDDNGNNARLLKGTDQFSFDVPNQKYQEIHLVFTSTEGASEVELKFDYTDGTSSSTKQQIIPDWYSSIRETNELYYLINGVDRSNADGTGFEDSNKPAVFGTMFTPDTTKILKKITVIKKSKSGNLVFLGATGLKNLT